MFLAIWVRAPLGPEIEAFACSQSEQKRRIPNRLVWATMLGDRSPRLKKGGP